VLYSSLYRKEGYVILFHQAEDLVLRNTIRWKYDSNNLFYRLLEIPGNKILDKNLRPTSFNKIIIEPRLDKTDFLILVIDEEKFIMGWVSHLSIIKESCETFKDQIITKTRIIIINEGDFCNMESTRYSHLANKRIDGNN